MVGEKVSNRLRRGICQLYSVRFSSADALALTSCRFNHAFRPNSLQVRIIAGLCRRAQEIDAAASLKCFAAFRHYGRKPTHESPGGAMKPNKHPGEISMSEQSACRAVTADIVVAGSNENHFFQQLHNSPD